MASSDVQDDEKGIGELLAGLDPNGPPRLAYVRKAPVGMPPEGGNLVCLSASFNPPTIAHVWLIQEANQLVPPDEVLLVLAKANVDKAAAGFPL